MAKKAVIAPAIPASAITPFELHLLVGLAGLRPIDESKEFIRLGSHHYAVTTVFETPMDIWDPEHPLAVDIPLSDPRKDGSRAMLLGEVLFGVEDVLQVILQRCPNIEQFVIEGAKTHSVMEPGAFGGFVSVVTRDGIRKMDTERMLDMLTAPPVKNRVVVLVNEDLSAQVMTDRPGEVNVAIVNAVEDDILGQTIEIDGEERNVIIMAPASEAPCLDVSEVFERATKVAA